MNALLHFLIGTWFVTYSNFPLWTKGNKTKPTFTYTLLERKNSPVLFDEVNYKKKGKVHTINGYDYPDKKDSTAFVWKGKGILSLLKSRWRVVLKDESGQWALIYFSKTLFTPEGVDFISRQPSLPANVLEQVKSFMQKDSTLKKFTGELKQINS